MEERGERQDLEPWNIVPSPGGSRKYVFPCVLLCFVAKQASPPEAQNSQLGGSGWSWWGEWVAGQWSGVGRGGWV